MGNRTSRSGVEKSGTMECSQWTASITKEYCSCHVECIGWELQYANFISFFTMKMTEKISWNWLSACFIYTTELTTCISLISIVICLISILLVRIKKKQADKYLVTSSNLFAICHGLLRFLIWYVTLSWSSKLY